MSGRELERPTLMVVVCYMELCEGGMMASASKCVFYFLEYC